MICTAASHAALKSAGPNAPQWLALQYLGRQADYGADLELRTCGQCGSTLAIETSPGVVVAVSPALAAACADALEAVQRAIDAVESAPTIEGCARLSALSLEIKKMLSKWCVKW